MAKPKIPKHTKFLKTLFEIMSEQENKMFFDEKNYSVTSYRSSHDEEEEYEDNYNDLKYQIEVNRVSATEFINGLYEKSFDGLVAFKSSNKNHTLECLKIWKDEEYVDEKRDKKKKTSVNDARAYGKANFKDYSSMVIHLLLSEESLFHLISNHELLYNKNPKNKDIKRVLGLSNIKKLQKTAPMAVEQTFDIGINLTAACWPEYRQKLSSKMYVIYGLYQGKPNDIIRKDAVIQKINENYKEANFLVKTNLATLIKLIGTSIFLNINGSTKFIKSKNAENEYKITFIDIQDNSFIRLVGFNDTIPKITALNKLDFFNLTEHIYTAPHFDEEEALAKRYEALIERLREQYFSNDLKRQIIEKIDNNEFEDFILSLDRDSDNLKNMAKLFQEIIYEGVHTDYPYWARPLSEFESINSADVNLISLQDSNI